MKNLFVILTVVAVCAVMFVSTTMAEISTKDLGGQVTVTVKHTYRFGNLNVTPKLITAGFQQHWAGLLFDNRGVVRPLAGFIVNWRDQDCVGYFGTRLDFSSDTTKTIRGVGEFYKITYDGDFFAWSAVDYNLKDTNSSYFGLTVEVANQGITSLWAGPHVGFGNFEFGLFFGETSFVRACYTIIF